MTHDIIISINNSSFISSQNIHLEKRILYYTWSLNDFFVEIGLKITTDGISKFIPYLYLQF